MSCYDVFSQKNWGKTIQYRNLFYFCSCNPKKCNMKTTALNETEKITGVLFLSLVKKSSTCPHGSGPHGSGGEALLLRLLSIE